MFQIDIPLLDMNKETVDPTALQSAIGGIGLSCCVFVCSVKELSLFTGFTSPSCRTSDRTLPSDSASLDTIDDGASSVPEAIANMFTNMFQFSKF